MFDARLQEIGLTFCTTKCTPLSVESDGNQKQIIVLSLEYTDWMHTKFCSGFSELPIVITIAPFVPDTTSDGVPIPDALRQLEELGGDVVGLNCGRGPSTMMPLLRECRKVCKVCCGYVVAKATIFRDDSDTDEECCKGGYADVVGL